MYGTPASHLVFSDYSLEHRLQPVLLGFSESFLISLPCAAGWRWSRPSPNASLSGTSTLSLFYPPSFSLFHTSTLFAL
jgi:hypothetical protein